MANHFEQFKFRVIAKDHRKWSEAQKLQILQEAEQNGLTGTSPSTHFPYLRFSAGNGQGTEGPKPHYKTVNPEVKRLQQESERLKKIIVGQALEIDFKDELLKKSH